MIESNGMTETIPQIRNLSGAYFRYRNADGKYENRCFEDLPESEQDRILSTVPSDEWIKNLCKLLARTLREIGENFNIVEE